MRKKIEFPPYEEAEVKAILEDGSVLCDLYGGEIAPAESLSEISADNSSDGSMESWTKAPEQWYWHDTDILFPAGSEIVSLTEQEKSEFEEEQKTISI